MQIRTAIDLGATIREHRRRLELDQRTLAQKAGVGRQWLVEVEGGKPRAEVGLILRTLDALGLSVLIDQGTERSNVAQGLPRTRPKNAQGKRIMKASKRTKSNRTVNVGRPAIDLDSLIEQARKKR